MHEVAVQSYGCDVFKKCEIHYFSFSRQHTTAPFPPPTMEHQQKAPPEIQRVAQFLRTGSSGLKVRVGALNGKRLDYFKGRLMFRVCLAYVWLTTFPPSRQISSESSPFTRLRQAQKRPKSHIRD